MQTTIIGNLANDPELRYTNNGVPVANITIAVNERTYNKTTQQYEDGETTWVKGTLWREQAENVVSLQKGTRIIAVGKIKTPTTYTTATGETRANLEIDIDEIAPSLKYATAVVTRNQRNPQTASATPTTNNGWDTPTPTVDPWATTTARTIELENETPF